MCEPCPSGTFKNAADQQWLTCIEKSAEACDQYVDEGAISHYCGNLDDLTASRPPFPFGQ